MSTQTTYVRRRGRFYPTSPWGVAFEYVDGEWLPVWCWSDSLYA